MSRTVNTPVGALEVTIEGSGPTVVLWHSLYVDDRSWDRVSGELSSLRRLVRITGPGHGASEPTAHPYSLIDCSNAAIAVLDALELPGPVDWVGNAWGGHVGLMLAASHGAHIRTLAAFNAPVQQLTSRQARSSRLLARVFRIVGPIEPVLAGVTETLLSPQTRADDPAVVAYVRECLIRSDRRGLVTAIRSISLGREDLRPLLPAIACPTLLVTTPEDALWTPEQAELAAASMPDATSAVITGGGHLTPLESPGETIALLRRLWGVDDQIQ